MKRIFVSGLLLVIAGHPAVAQDSYLGAGLGQASVDIIAEEIDDESSAFKLFAGFLVGRRADLEIAYVDFGEFSRGIDAGADRINLRKEGTAIALSLLGKLPFFDQSAFFLRGGLYRWDLDMSFGTPSGTNNDDGVSLLLGSGFERKFSGWEVRAEWERYTDLGTDSTGGKTDLDLITLSVLSRF